MKKINTIALVAPSGNIRDFEKLNKQIQTLEKYFKVKKYFDEDKNFYYLSDTDENRAKYFTDAFSDDEVDFVISLRGGYGAIRTLDKIDFESIKNSDKYYLSSSDGSILLSALSKKTNIKCFHGLMISNGFCENLSQNIKIIENDIFDINLNKIYSSKKSSKGALWGGNLSSIVCLLGDEKYLPDRDIILFVEDLNEAPYRVDKMLYQIYSKDFLRDKIKGIIFGDFYLSEAQIGHILEDFSKLFDVNCYTTFDITHKINNITIPYMKEISLS